SSAVAGAPRRRRRRYRLVAGRVVSFASICANYGEHGDSRAGGSRARTARRTRNLSGPRGKCLETQQRIESAMRAILPLLVQTDFPALRGHALETREVILGYKWNQSCGHCHVNAGPNRTEMVDEGTVQLVPPVLEARQIKTLDLTGGAPEL